MQRTLENLAKAGYLRAHAQGHLYTVIAEAHKPNPNLAKLRSGAEAAITALEALRRVHATIDRKTFLLLSELSEHQTCHPG